MTRAPYKVHLGYHFRATPPLPPGATGISLTSHRFMSNFIDHYNAMEFEKARRYVEAWLEDNDRANHLVNIYDNKEDGLCVDLSDRNTALLLKLAI